MAGADVIGTAICIALLVIVAYVVAGSILTTTGLVINAQNDMTLSQQERLETSINITYAIWTEDCTPSPNHFDVIFHVQNTGETIISDFSKVNFFVIQTVTNTPLYIKYNPYPGNYNLWHRNWTSVGIYQSDNGDRVGAGAPAEVIHPGQLDPGEYLYGEISVILCYPVCNECYFEEWWADCSCSDNGYNKPVILYAVTGNGVSAGRSIQKLQLPPD